MLTECETLAAPHLEKLRSGDIALSLQEKSELATFIALCYTRTAAFREVVNATTIAVFRLAVRKTLKTEGAFEEAVEAVCAEKDIDASQIDKESLRKQLEGIATNEVEVTQQSKAWAVKKAFEQADEYSEIFLALKWLLLEAPQGEAFITSDNPVIVIDPVVIHGPQRFKHSWQMQLHFPVCSRFYLVGVVAPPPDRRVLINSERVRGLNENSIRHAHHEIYASYWSLELQTELERVFAERDPLIKELPADLLE